MNLERYRNRQGKIWLNIGSGYFFLDEFLNVDSNFLVLLAPFYPLLKPWLKAPARHWIEGYQAQRTADNFLFANCRRPLRFPPASVDHILTSHFLEHLHFHDAVAAVQDYFTLLRPGGTLHLIVPDVAAKAREYVDKQGDPAAADEFVTWMNFEKRSLPRLAVRLLWATGWFDMEHRWLYDQHSLGKLVQDLGFKILAQNDSPSAAFRRDDPCQVNILMQKPAVLT